MITVLCHGIFDIVHPGHLEHFRQAKEHGGRLVVAIVADAYVRKGPGHPMFNQEQRASMLRALAIVDQVIIVEDATAMPVLRSLRPDIYCKGPDYADPNHQFAKEFQKDKAFVKSYGGQVILTKGFTSSSSAIIKRMEQGPVLDYIREQHGLAGVLSWIERGRQAKAIVIGESIVDEYIYVRPLSKSSKENIISFEEIGRAKWNGGVQVIEQILRHSTGSVIRHPNGSVIHKLRYVDAAFNQKLFSLVSTPKIEPIQFDRALSIGLLIVVADYGHGFIDNRAAKAIGNDRGLAYLVLNVQSNSANWGFNLLTKWPRADYVVADQNELRLACADRDSPIEDLLIHMARQMNTRYFALTLGHEGCIVHGGTGTTRLHALTDKVVDRMGAGDAFLAATAPLAWAGAPPEIIALVGNVAGAIKVGKLGNQPVTRIEVETWLQRLIG